ncbi:hypothetical protein Ahy_A10g050030 [Arachis hypogaea]|uniref:DUF223 domain-containing protein n=1 Tax=Arachis hypogaea TaxID=3818 RepID=A0A445B8H3_ARAHY|nr:hypothetical protein Ahy_A10g050030 [Arachis hypogaea]
MVLQDIKKWRGNVVEFNMHVMSNYIVVDEKEKIRTTVNRWTINFSQETTVLLIPHPNVIGEVIEKEDPRKFITSKGRETKHLDVLIKDLENNGIGYVLFENMVDQILPYLEEERVESLIVITQCFKSSRWNMHSHFEYSKLHINLDLERKLVGKSTNSARINQVLYHGPHSSAEELKRGRWPIWIASTIVSINSDKDD